MLMCKMNKSRDMFVKERSTWLKYEVNSVCLISVCISSAQRDAYGNHRTQFKNQKTSLKLRISLAWTFHPLIPLLTLELSHEDNKKVLMMQYMPCSGWWIGMENHTTILYFWTNVLYGDFIIFLCKLVWDVFEQRIFFSILTITAELSAPYSTISFSKLS